MQPPTPQATAALDALCTRLYTATQTQDRHEAQQSLCAIFPFFTSDASPSRAASPSIDATLSPFDTLANCQSILQQSQCSYTFLFIASHLRAILMRYASSFPASQKSTWRIILSFFRWLISGS
jgi:hypothetical protein